jgi:hypothetical protein
LIPSVRTSQPELLRTMIFKRSSDPSFLHDPDMLCGSLFLHIPVPVMTQHDDVSSPDMSRGDARWLDLIQSEEV